MLIYNQSPTLNLLPQEVTGIISDWMPMLHPEFGEKDKTYTVYLNESALD